MNAAPSNASEHTSLRPVVTRHRQKRLTLQVKPDGTLAVRAPYWLPSSRIDTFLKQKSRWIGKQWQRQQQFYRLTGRRLTDKTTIEVRTHRQNDFKVIQTRSSIILHCPDSYDLKPWDTYQHLRPAIKERLRKEAAGSIPAHVKSVALRHGLAYHSVRLRFVRSRWGSCNRDGILMFNTQVMCLPADLRKYVICHELAHTRHMHHGQAFHRLLEGMIPNAADFSKRLAKQQLLQ